ncbi:unnamed protein product [Pipistrellus nathusii]|uniref:Homeobox domain-containing protein n=1 Tax=Pipistrellus nathusii TaxID=59473 RepID=A0ABN9ZRU6_PIPNA
MASNRPGGSGRRKRTKFSESQLQVLIKAFEKDEYPDVTAQKELAKKTQIPQSRIQVWFQNRRGRRSKNSQKRPRPDADTAAPGSHQGAFPAPKHHRGLQGLSPQYGSGRALQSNADHFSWGAERASGPAGHWGHGGVLGANVVSPNLEIPANALGEPSSNFHHSSAMGAFPVPQQPFQAEAGGIDTHLGDPRALIYEDPHFPFYGQHP